MALMGEGHSARHSSYHAAQFPAIAFFNSNSHYGNGMATVNHFMLSQLSKLARLEAEMSRNIDFYALLAPEMAGITFVAFDQQP